MEGLVIVIVSVIGAVLGMLIVGVPLGVWVATLRRTRRPQLASPEPPDPALIPVAAFRVDGAGEILWTSTLATGLFGPGLVGRNFETVLGDWSAIEAQRSTAWKAPSGEPLGTVWSLYATTQQESIPVRVQRTPAGEGWWVVLRDMRGVHKQLERMTQANQRFQLARDEAQHASRAKSTYLTGVAQVLRTPLNTIVGYSELLSEELEDRGLDDLASDVAKVLAGSAALTTILETVLDWTEIEAGRMSVKSEIFEVSDTLEEVTSGLREEIEAQNELVVDVPEGLRALADSSRVGQIVRQLLENAAKHTRAGTVSLAARKVGTHVVIVVEDTGEGMVAGELEELFIGFEERASRGGAGGTGISLLLAHTFAKMMGGSLTVSSLKGRGSSFMLELPGADDDAPPPPMML